MNKKTLLNILQGVVTLGILCFLFRDGKKNHEMLEALVHADKLWIAAGLGFFGVVQLCAVLRWNLLLRVQGVEISLGRLASLSMIGLFFNPLMPGGTGGDVAKIYYVLKEAKEKQAQALLAVLMDRIVGLFTLIVVAGAFIVGNYSFLTRTPVTSGLLYTLLTIFAASFAFIAGSFTLSCLGLIHKLPPKAPLRDKLVELSLAYNVYARAWPTACVAFLLSVPVHLSSFAVFYCAFRAIPGMAGHASLFDFLSIMPIVNTIAAVPISVGGTGLREGLFVHLLGDLCQIPAAGATIISLTGFMIQVLWGVAGGVVYMVYRPSEHAKVAAMEKAVAEAEHNAAEEAE